MDDTEKAVIIANRDFYTAFNNADVTAMSEVWASDHELTVIHPGWPPLYGRGKVLASWEAIFSQDNSPAISVAGERVYIMQDIAYVICTELLAQTELIATNILVREEGDWKMIHHQAGLLSHDQTQGSVH